MHRPCYGVQLQLEGAWEDVLSVSPCPILWGYKMPLPTIPAPTSRLCLLMAAEARACWWLLLCLWKSRINPLGPHNLPPLPLHICLGLTAGMGQHIQAQTAHLFA